MSNTLYDILEVSPDASAGVIHSTYRILAQRWHPDKNTGDPAATDMMAEINRAYAILSDPSQRMIYDASLLTTPHRWRANHATDSSSRGTNNSPPPTKSAHRDDRITSHSLMTSMLFICLMTFIAIFVYLMLFQVSDGPVTEKAESAKFRELVDLVEKTNRDDR